MTRWCKREFGMTFQEYSQQNGGVALKIKLRKNQIELSKKSAAMAIFLGKNYLGQKDTIIETDEQTLQAVGEALVKIKRAAEQADNNE